MSLVDKKRSTVHSLYMEVRGDRLKVEHILAFADELRRENVPLNELVAGSVNHSTFHCTGLSVRQTLEETAP